MGSPRVRGAVACWVAALVPEAGAEAGAVAAALRSAGLGVEEVPPGDAPGGPGVVVLSGRRGGGDGDPGQQLRLLADGGRRQVLVLALHPLAPDQVWRLLDAGAEDVLPWAGGDATGQVVARLAHWVAVEAALDAGGPAGRLVGDAAGWRRALREAVAAAATTTPVLLTGETGTGKELVARLVHELDPRPDKGQLVVVDCTTVVPTLSGSEFFGHEKGAFTGAVSAREGAFGLAHRGTLFLDEVGELPLPLQAELLRVVQEGAYKRVGSNVWQRTRFRLVCATHQDLTLAQEEGRFRRDFYYRIAGCLIHLPPLRERPEDVLPLFTHFLAQISPRDEPWTLDPLVAEALACRAYPGNVRDLRQLAQRVAVRHPGPGPVSVGDLPVEDRPAATTRPVAAPSPDRVPPRQRDHWPQRDHRHIGGRSGETPGRSGEVLAEAVRGLLAAGATLRDVQEAATEAAIAEALADADGGVGAAARRLGVTARALQLRRARRVAGAAGAAPSAGAAAAAAPSTPSGGPQPGGAPV